MPVSNLVVQGAFLMALGMGVVFVFLGVLVACVTAVTRLTQRYAAQPAAVAENPAEPAPPSDLMSDPELVSVITSVIHKYRTEKGLPPKA